MAVITEVFKHIPIGAVTAGGTTAPVAGTSESWTVTAVTAFPATTATAQFHVCDPAANTELILVTSAPGGTGSGQSWTVTRGAGGTTPVTHSGGFTIYQVAPAGFLNAPVFNGLMTAASGLATGQKTLTTNYTVTAADTTLLLNGSSGLTITLLDATTCPGQIFAFVNENNNSGTINPTASQTIDGGASVTISQNQSVVLQSDGSNWWIIASVGVIPSNLNISDLATFSSGIGVTGLSNLNSIATVVSSQSTSFTIPAFTSVMTYLLTAGITVTHDQTGNPEPGGLILAFKQTAAATSTISIADGNTIDGASSLTLTQYQGVIIQWDGTSNWDVLASEGFTKNNILDDGAGNLKTAAAISTSGLTGATAASRYVGATTSGAPGSGTFAKGDFIIDQTGAVWVCTTAGSPGTWTGVGGLSGVTVSGTAAAGDIIAATSSSAATWTNKLTVNTSTGAASFAGVAAHTAGTDTSGTAAASSPTFVSGTAQQPNTTQDIMLYIAVNTATTVEVQIGPTSGVADTICNIAAAISVITIRVPKAWWVKITATIADLTITAVTC